MTLWNVFNHSVKLVFRFIKPIQKHHSRKKKRKKKFWLMACSSKSLGISPWSHHWIFFCEYSTYVCTFSLTTDHSPPWSILQSLLTWRIFTAFWWLLLHCLYCTSLRDMFCLQPPVQLPCLHCSWLNTQSHCTSAHCSSCQSHSP